MSAGIVVMNSGAVALAADRVATIPYHEGVKHYDSAIKVHALHTQAPVAVLWYGCPHYLGLPWGTIAEEFRHAVSQRHAEVDGYAHSFLAFINKEIAVGASKSAGSSSVAMLTHRLFAQVQAATSGTSTDATTVVQEAVQQWKKSLRPSARVLDPSALENWPELWAWFDTAIEQLGNLPCQAIEALREAVRFAWSRISAREPGHTGLVFAGFGEEQRMPSMLPYLVGIPAGRYSRQLSGKRVAISSSNPATVVPFGGSDAIRLFLEGVHPSVLRWLAGALGQMGEHYGLDEQLTDRIIRGLHDFIDTEGMPVVDTIQLLPKAELAESARALMSFTAFRLWMSHADEPVGPIDVAVLSRGEGLVWVDDPSTFPVKLNPHSAHRDSRPSREERAWRLLSQLIQDPFENTNDDESTS